MFKTIRTILKLKGLRKTPVSDKKFINDLRLTLESYIKNNPANQENILYYKQNRFTAGFRFAPAISMAAVFVLLTATGVAVASQKSLPGDALYPVKIVTENIRVGLTANPQAKVKLQTQFALERVTEIERVAQKKETTNDNVNTALSNFQNNLDRATQIIQQEKNKGNGVENMADTLSQKITTSTEAIHRIFRQQGQELKSQEEKTKLDLEAAQKSNDTAKLQELNNHLNQIQNRKSSLDSQKQTLNQFLDNQQQAIQNDLSDKNKAESALSNAQIQKQDVIDDNVSPDKLAPVDKLLNDAKSAFQSGDYNKAKESANQAKNELKKLGD